MKIGICTLNENLFQNEMVRELPIVKYPGLIPWSLDSQRHFIIFQWIIRHHVKLTASQKIMIQQLEYNKMTTCYPEKNLYEGAGCSAQPSSDLGKEQMLGSVITSPCGFQ